MKKGFLAILIVCFAVLAVMAQDTSVNVNAYTIPELSTVPVIDGDLSDAVWADVPSIPMDKDGDSPAAAPGTGDLDIDLKIAWDDETNALYFHLDVIDDSLVAYQSLGSTAGTGGWNNERLEIVMDGLNTGDAASTTTTGLHQQYTFDMPNTWDPWDPGNDIDNNVLISDGLGMFNIIDGGVAVSSDFITFPVLERIEGTLNLDNTHAPWDIADDYLESAGLIRVTDPSVEDWIEAPVEYTWEIKLVPFEFLTPATDLGYDIDDPANIASGWADYFTDDLHDPLDMEEGKVIGCSPQMNDADIWPDGGREHQTNTTGVAGNWNSSESLTGLILGATVGGGSSVLDWNLQ